MTHYECTTLDTTTNKCTQWVQVESFFQNLTVEEGQQISAMVIGSLALAYMFRTITKTIKGKL